MANFASGKHALGISDRSGRTYKLREMIKEWNGLLVGKDEYESKQPQLEPRHTKADPQALRQSRPDRSGSAVITVTEPGHGRTTGDTVRFRNVENFDGFTESVIESSSGYSITKVDADSYTFTTSSETATTGNIKGGGGFASAGPVTVSA
jgi:hypothetical protein